MHNWWLASLEHFGLITREEAEHIAGEIKSTIHKDSYTEAYNELEAILNSSKLRGLPILTRLQSEVTELHTEIDKLKSAPPKVLASSKKV